MNINSQIDIPAIRGAVDACCRGTEECGHCTGKDCLMGFAKLVSEYAGAKQAISIPAGLKMVPTADFKMYEVDAVAKALAVINRECKNCQDSHDDNCVINIIRSSLEVALLGRHMEFTGNPLNYVMELAKTNPAVGNKVMQAYMELRQA